MEGSATGASGEDSSVWDAAFEGDKAAIDSAPSIPPVTAGLEPGAATAHFTGFDYERKSAWRALSSNPEEKLEYAHVSKLYRESDTVMAPWSDGTRSSLALQVSELPRLQAAFFTAEAKRPVTWPDGSKVYVQSAEKGTQFRLYRREAGATKQAQLCSIHVKDFSDSDSAFSFARLLATDIQEGKVTLKGVQAERDLRLGKMSKEPAEDASVAKKPPKRCKVSGNEAASAPAGLSGGSSTDTLPRAAGAANLASAEDLDGAALDEGDMGGAAGVAGDVDAADYEDRCQRKRRRTS